MKKYIIALEYQSKEYMDVSKILIFKRNLEKIEAKGYVINLFFYGKYTNEELVVCMSYLNKLLQKNVCEVAVSTKTKEICYIKKDRNIFEGGANHKSLKMSEKNLKELKNKKFDSLIKNHYKNEKIEIKYWPITNWQSTILELIGE